MQRSIELWANSGGPGKVYQVFLIPEGDGYRVNFANGRKGGTLAHGTKTATPVPLEAAQKIFDKVVREKLTGSSKYQVVEGEAPTAAVTAAGELVPSGIDPMLLNPIDPSKVSLYLHDPIWCFQVKRDGERRPVKHTPGTAPQGVNKKGYLVPLSGPIAAAIANITIAVEFDSEQVGDTLYVFDVLSVNGVSILNEDLDSRLDVLNTFRTADYLKPFSDTIVFVDTAFTAADKIAMFEREKANNGEGIVLKRRSSKYVGGRPNSGGDWLKAKNVTTLTAQVIKHSEGARSVEIGVYDEDGSLRSLKNVTVPVSQAIPDVGQFAEIKYLYAWATGGLAQPVFLGIRTDADKSDAKASQLKFKAE
ncbi:MAG: hypothetical protein LW865_01715 [Betaproteobacteria bacterium]|jgi:bifunctional non-homologous end joining protein LigD|nr:hypothetical protein [Betaproteobacteria bacterium]